MAQVSVTGYTDKPSVVEGETISFYVTADNATEAQVDIVRLIHGDEDPKGPGFQEEVVKYVESNYDKSEIIGIKVETFDSNVSVFVEKKCNLPIGFGLSFVNISAMASAKLQVL